MNGSPVWVPRFFTQVFRACSHLGVSPTDVSGPHVHNYQREVALEIDEPQQSLPCQGYQSWESKSMGQVRMWVTVTHRSCPSWDPSVLLFWHYLLHCSGLAGPSAFQTELVLTFPVVRADPVPVKQPNLCKPYL